MKKKLAILDSDRNYLEKMKAYFDRRYPEEIEFFLFTSIPAALDTVAESQFNLFLINKSMEVSAEDIPDNCVYAYLSDIPSINCYNDHPVICKFQRIDLLLNQIQEVIEEGSKQLFEATPIPREGKIILFCGAGGGVGTSCVAAACAAQTAKTKNVAYLNLDTLGGADLYFSGDGEKGMTDLIGSLHNQDTDFIAQLRCSIRKDASGVFFISEAQSALDMLDLGATEIVQLLSELKNTQEYDHIILDMAFSADKAMLPVYEMSDTIVMVGDSSWRSKIKADKALNALRVLAENSDMAIFDRIHRIYNRTDAENEIEDCVADVPVLGVIHTYEPESLQAESKDKKVIEMIASLDLFKKIM